MVLVKPFRGLRPKPEFVDKVACPPYDVISTQEARSMAADNPYSFLYVSKPEISLPENTPQYSDLVYQTGRRNLQRLIQEKVLVQDEKESVYVYKLIWQGHEQIGYMILSSVQDYLTGKIKKHELTKPDKVADRTKLVDTQGAQGEPVLLFYPAFQKLDSILHSVSAIPAVYDFHADETRHQFWKVDDPLIVEKVIAGFAEIEATYVADGHHRSAAAANLYGLRKTSDPQHNDQLPYNYFLTVIFPDNHLKILPYNRVVADLNQLTTSEFLEKAGKKFEVTIENGNQTIVSSTPHLIGMYLDRQWYRLTPKPGSYDYHDPISKLDVSILSENLLAPVLGITDPRTDTRIDFIGGIRGTAELVRLVDSGKFKIAFSMPPVSLAALKEVTDAGEIMPPKSTWFEPKLRSGLVLQLLE